MKKFKVRFITPARGLGDMQYFAVNGDSARRSRRGITVRDSKTGATNFVPWANVAFVNEQKEGE